MACGQNTVEFYLKYFSKAQQELQVTSMGGQLRVVEIIRNLALFYNLYLDYILVQSCREIRAYYTLSVKKKVSVYACRAGVTCSSYPE